MAEYNPSKIIKDGNTYNFRDTTKIPLAGSNEISGSLIPNTDGTVNLGSPSYQWNNAYIKSLTINGVACGDILTYNASEFIPRSGGAVLDGAIFSRNDTDKQIIFRSGPNHVDGASIQLNGKNLTAGGGRANLIAHDGTNTAALVIMPSGIFMLNNGSYLRPSSDNSCMLGASTYRWSGVYSNAYYLGDTAFGNIVTHDMSEFVNLTGAQTIGGQKTFTASPRVTKAFPDIALNISDCDVTEAPTEAKYASLYFRDKNNKYLAYITGQQRTDGSKRMCLRTHRTDDINKYYSVDFDSDGDFYPEQNNTLRLGTPALQWNATYTRNILIDNDINIASSLINKTSSSGVLSIRGGLTTPDGASIGLYGKDYNGAIAGNIYMTAYGNSDYTNFRIYPNGTMSVYNNSTNTTKTVAMQEDVNALLNNKANSSHTHTTSDITDFPTIPTKTSDLTNDSGFLTSHQDLSGYIPRSGGAVLTGDLLASSTINSIGFGYGWGSGGTIYTYSPTHSTAEWQGTIRLEPLKTTSNFKTMQLAPGGTWTWNGTACQITSDQRFKQQITEIDDKLLDAWEDVELSQFKYNDAVEQKGKDKARLHTGFVVQQIDSACKKHGVDISNYGLYCHEVYPEETKEVEIEQADGTKTKETKVIREAGEHYSLRYTEALIVECKYLRRCVERLTARIEELEKGNNSK